MISSDLKCSQQCMYAYTKANRVMGMIRKTISYKKPRIMLVSLYKTLVKVRLAQGETDLTIYCGAVVKGVDTRRHG